jgi:hypothetical protein
MAKCHLAKCHNQKATCCLAWLLVTIQSCDSVQS